LIDFVDFPVRARVRAGASRCEPARARVRARVRALAGASAGASSAAARRMHTRQAHACVAHLLDERLQLHDVLQLLLDTMVLGITLKPNQN